MNRPQMSHQKIITPALHKDTTVRSHVTALWNSNIFLYVLKETSQLASVKFILQGSWNLIEKDTHKCCLKTEISNRQEYYIYFKTDHAYPDKDAPLLLNLFICVFMFGQL